MAKGNTQEYCLGIIASGGEIELLRGEDVDYIDDVADAINEAIVKRG